MSIEVTRLSVADGRDISVIKSWFDANADELFDSIEISEDTLLLKNDSTTEVSIFFESSCVTVNVYVNSSLTITKSPGSNSYIDRLAKTPHGIALSFSGNPYGVFIAKTNLNRTGVLIGNSLSANILAGGFYFESIGGTIRTSTTSSTLDASRSLADDVTTLTPCICEGSSGEYMPDCFFTTFSQYKGIDCTFTADGNEYLYNGFIAMR